MAGSQRIVTVGGGTGAPTVIRALLKLGIEDITAVCASMDSGGRAGVMRTDERDSVIAVSDLLRNLLALIPPDQRGTSRVKAFEDMVDFTDGRDRNVGYHVYYALLEKYDNRFFDVQEHLQRLLGVRFRGHAIPVTICPSNVALTTRSGKTFIGEHELDRLASSKDTIEKIWLVPPVSATPEAQRAIGEADTIVYCPGSLYGSILANFLPRGMKRALKQSRARKILVTNLVSDRNQTHGFTPRDYLEVFRKYTGLRRPFDAIVVPQISREQFDTNHPDVASDYDLEHSHFLGWEQHELRELQGVEIQAVPDLYLVTGELRRVRHQPEKLAAGLGRVI